MIIYRLALNILVLLLSMSVPKLVFSAEISEISNQVAEMKVPISKKILISKIKDAEENSILDEVKKIKLRCFVPEMDYRLSTITALHKIINQKFNDAGLVIAFPQCDVHLGSEKPLDIRIQRS